MTDLDDVYAALDGYRRELAELKEQIAAADASGNRRRVSKDDVLATLLARLTQTGGEHSTVRLARNAKGDMQFEIVVRTGDTPEIQSAADAMAEANRLAEALALIYPMPGQTVAEPKGES